MGGGPVIKGSLSLHTEWDLYQCNGSGSFEKRIGIVCLGLQPVGGEMEAGFNQEVIMRPGGKKWPDWKKQLMT